MSGVVDLAAARAARAARAAERDGEAVLAELERALEHVSDEDVEVANAVVADARHVGREVSRDCALFVAARQRAVAEQAAWRVARARLEARERGWLGLMGVAVAFALACNFYAAVLVAMGVGQ